MERRCLMVERRRTLEVAGPDMDPIGEDSLIHLKHFFRSDGVWRLETPFSFKDFFDITFTLELENGFFDESEEGLSPEEAAMYANVIKAELSWLFAGGFTEMTGLPRKPYMLSEEGKKIVRPN